MRNLVLLLSSGHTVRIALRDDDLTGNGGPTDTDVHDFLTMLPALVLVVGGKRPEYLFAYIEQPMSLEFDRISVITPGADRG